MHDPATDPTPDARSRPAGGHGGSAGDALADCIEHGADRLLEEVGIRFEDDPETIDMLVEAGGVARGTVVRLEGAALRRIIRRSAPDRFLLRGRNARRDTIIGQGSDPVFAPVYGAPDVLREDGVRVKGTREIYRRLVSEAHAASGLANTGHMICVMDDVRERARPLEMLSAHLALSDKPFMGSIASPEIAREVIALTRAAVGRPERAGECNLLHLVNSSPPLTYWGNPLKCLRAIACEGEASIVSSYMMLGATAPVTPVGALIQGYAEVLAGLALTQLWRPGAPVVMGILGYPFDMRTMLPSFGDPASQLMQLGVARLGRRLGVPVRADGAVTSAMTDDAQAGAEGGRGVLAAIGSDADFVLHGAGWLERGRCLGWGKFRRDAAALADLLSVRARSGEPLLPLDPAIEQDLGRRLARLAG